MPYPWDAQEVRDDLTALHTFVVFFLLFFLKALEHDSCVVPVVSFAVGVGAEKGDGEKAAPAQTRRRKASPHPKQKDPHPQPL